LLCRPDLKLPFWLFNFEEFTDILYGGRQVVTEEIEILAELIPLAKQSYQQIRQSADRLSIKRKDPNQSNLTADTPIPYLLQDLILLIDERMGKLENRSSRMVYRRLMMRIEALKNDTRYAFMFESANVGGDTMAHLLSQLFRLEHDGKPITILQLASLPTEVVDAVVCLVSRFAFEFGLWSDGEVPLLLLYEEAHRYVSADHTMGFSPVRRAISRIAKEGRKYGVYLGLVSQRPAELDPTIISQCSTLFAMRMVNDQDQSLLRSAVSDAGADLLNFIPTLGTGEVVGFGEGLPLPTRMVFTDLNANLVPRSESTMSQDKYAGDLDQTSFVKAVVERWRGTKTQGMTRPDPIGAMPAGDDAQGLPYVSALDRGIRAAFGDHQ
jgi:DNA helicase HerA-like ATPase